MKKAKFIAAALQIVSVVCMFFSGNAIRHVMSEFSINYTILSVVMLIIGIVSSVGSTMIVTAIKERRAAKVKTEFTVNQPIK